MKSFSVNKMEKRFRLTGDDGEPEIKIWHKTTIEIPEGKLIIIYNPYSTLYNEILFNSNPLGPMMFCRWEIQGATE